MNNGKHEEKAMRNDRINSVRGCATLAIRFIAVLSPLAIHLGLAQSNQQPNFITFDAPGAVNGTAGSSINPEGAITGFYTDVNFVQHGFVRTPDGSLTSFDAPGAGTGGFAGTVGYAINPAGAITGQVTDANYNTHGFLRARDGSFSVFDGPESNGTFASSINPAGTIAGYINIDGVPDPGFLRAPDGTITTFGPPGSLNTLVFGNSINPAGAIAGWIFFGNPTTHDVGFLGFLRTPDGAFTTFNVPGSGQGIDQGTGGYSMAINQAGAITGTYIDASGTIHGFLRAPDGAITTFDPQGSTRTTPVAMNPAGVITGYYTDASGTTHGFLRTAGGTITTLDPPGSTLTQPSGINPAGVITGGYCDASGACHGFLRQ